MRTHVIKNLFFCFTILGILSLAACKNKEAGGEGSKAETKEAGIDFLGKWKFTETSVDLMMDLMEASAIEEHGKEGAQFFIEAFFPVFRSILGATIFELQTNKSLVINADPKALKDLEGVSGPESIKSSYSIKGNMLTLKIPSTENPGTMDDVQVELIDRKGKVLRLRLEPPPMEGMSEKALRSMASKIFELELHSS